MNQPSGTPGALHSPGSPDMLKPSGSLAGTAAAEACADTAGPKNGQTSAQASAQASAQKSDQPSGQTCDKPCGRAERLFYAACRVGPLTLLLVLALQAWPFFWSDVRSTADAPGGNALFCPREMQSIAAFDAARTHGQWLTPAAPLPAAQNLAAPGSAANAGSAPSTLAAAALAATMPGGQSQWPLYTLFLAATAHGSALLPGNPLYPAAAFLSTLFALMGVWSLSRAAGFGPQQALAAGLILLCAPLFAPLSHFVGPEALSAGLLLFSLTFFCRGLQKERAWGLLTAGFLAAAAAGFCGGPFPLLLPLAAGLIFLLRRGKFRRIQAPDALTGFTLLLLAAAGWTAWVILAPPPGNYLADLAAQAFRMPDFSPARLKYLPPITAALGLAPWLIIALCVSWGRVLRTAKTDILQPSTAADFLWISLIAGCVLSLVSADGISTAVCLMCLAAPLLAKALLRLSALGSRFFYLVAALLLLHAGMALAAAGFEPTLDWMVAFFKATLSPERRELILSLKTLPILGVLCIAAALTLTRFTRRDRPAGALLVCIFFAVLLAQPAGLLFPLEAAQRPEIPLRRAAVAGQAAQPLTPADAPVASDVPHTAPDALPAPNAAPDAVPDAGSDTLPPAAPESIPTVPPAAAGPAEPAPKSAVEPTPESTPELAPEAVPESLPDTTAQTPVAPAG